MSGFVRCVWLLLVLSLPWGVVSARVSCSPDYVGLTPTPVLVWDYDPSAIEFRGVDGFRIYARHADATSWILAAELACQVGTVESTDSFGNPVSLELYKCAGARENQDPACLSAVLPGWQAWLSGCRMVPVPLQRYFPSPLPRDSLLDIEVRAYLGSVESAAGSIQVCWPAMAWGDHGEPWPNWSEN